MTVRILAAISRRSQSPARIWRRVMDRMALRRQRRALARLDDRLLNDIGIDDAAARAEAARPVWDPPAHWMR